MRWILLDLVVALTALVVLAVLVLRLWRKVKALGATVREAGERVERATDALAVAQLGVAPVPHDPPGAGRAEVVPALGTRTSAAGAPAARELRRGGGPPPLPTDAPRGVA